MNPARSPLPPDENEEVSALIETLHATERRLAELTAGEVDTVTDREGRTLLLRRPQEQLRHIEAAKQAAVLNALPAHIALLDTQGLIISVNEAWRRFGRAHALHVPGYGIGLNYFAICDSARGDGSFEAHQVAKGIRSVLNGEATCFSIEYPCHSPMEQRWFLMTVTPLADDHPNGAVVMHVDITERRRTHTALAHSEAGLHRAQLMAKLAHVITGPDGSFETWSDTLPSLIGVEPAQLPRTTRAWLDILHPDDRPLFRDKAIEAGVRNQRVELEYRVRRADGEWIHVRQTMEPIEVGADTTASRWFNTLQDVTAERRTEDSLRESEERFRATFEQAAAGMGHVTLEGRWVRVNQRLCDIVGYTREELLARTFQDITHPDDLHLELLEQRRLIAGEIQTMSREKRYLHKNRSVVWIDLTVSILREPSGEPRYFIAVVQDITARKQLEQELLHAQRMEGVGQLAGGIAHDFNNLLTVIGGRSQIALEKLQSADPLRRDLDLIKKTSDRAAGLTRQLLAFSRKQVLQPRVVDPNVMVSNSTNLLKRLIGEDIELVFVPAADIGRVRVDPGQLEQVIVNLAVNARDAMPEGGRLTIETSNVALDAAYAGRHVGILPGRYVMLAVSDSGVGMDAAIQARIFEPFFTTKNPGKGTGLGLATVYGIVKQSGGHIRVYSEPGVGTVFKIYLARTDAAPEAEPAADTMLPRGTETILLVEDEEEVRALAREVLESLGYTLLEAANPTEAILIAKQHMGLVDLLLTDVVMPRMGGGVLAQALHASRPETKVLFMSGYTDDAIVRHGVLEAGVQMLEKPFSPQTLAAKVRAVLDQKQ